MNKTLLYCTGYGTSDLDWDKRWRRWYDYNKQKGLHFDQLLIVDNGSPELPGWSDNRVIYNLDRPWYNKNIVIYRYEDTLDINAHLIRSAQIAKQYTTQYGFDKLLHMESHVYILSKRLAKFINEHDLMTFPCKLDADYIGGNYGQTHDVLPNNIDYATGIDEDWDDVHQKYLDTKRKYTYTRT